MNTEKRKRREIKKVCTVKEQKISNIHTVGLILASDNWVDYDPFLLLIEDKFENLGIKPGVTMALLAELSEFIGGAIFTLGLLTPLASILIAGSMVVAILKLQSRKRWGQRLKC